MQSPKRVIRFAAFEVDIESGEVRKHGLRIRLQDQPFKILVALLEKPGEVVSRDELRERIWGNETFVDFNHGLNAAVNRLRDALGDSAESPRYIETLARRGYRFVATLDLTQEQAMATTAADGPRRRLRWTVSAALAVAGLLFTGYWLMGGRVAVPPPRLVQVTAYTGSETMPTFSPDGKQVAFVWNGEKEGDANIYAKVLGTETALQLTNDPGADLLPSWSPDGRQIAFVRVRGKTGIFVVTPLGGPERKLLEFPGEDRRPAGPETRIVGDLLYPIVNRPSWSVDGRFVAVVRNSEPPEPGDGAVLLIPSEGGEPRRMLIPQPGTWYKHPTFSPEGGRMAVALIKAQAGRAPTCELQILTLSPNLQSQDEPRTVLSDCQQLRGIAWTPDGESLIVSGFKLPHYYAWRVSAKRAAAPERIEMAGAEALWPAVSAAAGHLVFARSILQADLWRLAVGERPSPFLSSTARDTNPRFSADGKSIAFQSGRGGTNDIWVARADGRELIQITKGLGRSAGSPVWSPSGQWIAFDSDAERGGTDVWIVEAKGGPPRQMTHGPGSNAIPSWSRDGKMIYFISSRSGRNEVWRVPVDGGTEEQITRNGGFAGQETWDGKKLIYIMSDSGSEGLYSVPLGGGEEKHLLADQVVRRSFDVVPGGIYYIAPRDDNRCDIRFHELASGRTRVVGEIERPVAFGLSVSPDQRTFLFSRPVTGADLMLIENFR